MDFAQFILFDIVCHFPQKDPDAQPRAETNVDIEMPFMKLRRAQQVVAAANVADATAIEMPAIAKVE